MKKIILTAGIFLFMIMAGMLLINNRGQDTNITTKTTTVAIVLNGSIDDKSWAQSHYEGLEKAVEQLNLKVVYRENIPADETCAAVIEELIDDGSEIIICASVGYGEWALQAAQKHPEVYFFQISGNETTKNLATYFGRMYQMRYLSGIVAGLQTETNIIGYVAAYPYTEVNRGINAFTLGVRAVNPEAEVHVEWIGDWSDDEAARKATEHLIDTYNIDILAMHTDSCVPLEIAEERGIWSIGYNRDNSELYPNSYLTALVWNWEKFYEPQISSCLNGKFQSKNYWEGIESGLVSLAPLTKNVKEGIAEVVEKEQARFMNGTYDVFYGPVCDTEGEVRVAEGESMPDDMMFNAFDWYVEGVEFVEKQNE